MTVSEVRVLLLFIDGTTEAPGDTCMAATAQAPKDEFSLRCEPGRPQHTPSPSFLPVLASSLSWSLVPGVHASLPHRRLPATGWELSVSGICRTPSLYLFSSVGLGLSLRVGAMLSVWCPALCSGHPPSTTSSSISQLRLHFFPMLSQTLSVVREDHDTLMWPAASFPM